MERSFVIGWIGTLLQLSLRLSWGIISVPISGLFHLDAIQIGLVATFFYLGYTTSSIPWGFVIDREGPSRSLTISSLVLIPLMALAYFVNNFITLLLIYLFAGLIASGIFPSAMKIVAIKNQENTLTARVALLESAAPITLILLSVTASLLVSEWRYFFVLLAISFSIISLVSSRTRIQVMHSNVKKSLRVLLDKKIFTATLVRMGELWATWGAVTWIFPLLILYRHLGVEFSALFLLLLSIGQLIGTLLATTSRIIGEKKFIALDLLGFIIIAISTVFSQDFILPVEAFTLGIFSFAYRPPTDSMIMKMAGSLSAGTSIGYANSISQIGTMIAPTLVGFLLYESHSFLIGIVGICLGCVISLICLNFV
ncbi:MFS transporter [Acidianus sp. RZ1]|uniref:MFS transporter n=1 Tax=Acidianus sp. RZ1 TaxID=1540082 RepID=UPI0014925958|nr:MFS transporter [Acidianus sp. RZ1]